jgi:hypothetical protein
MERSNAFFIGIITVCILLIPAAGRCDYIPRKGFVTLEFSDTGLLNYTHIYPLLESHGFKGSFAYVTEVSAMGIEHDAWMMQEIYLAGHEVQDHTTRHDYMWATHVDTVDDGVWDWVPYTFADVATWDSLCERSLFILDSLGIEEVVGWGHPGGGTNAVVPGHPDWRWHGDQNDSLTDLIATKYPYVLQGAAVAPHTAHVNLRGHNCPDRFPFFSVPHVTIDGRGAEQVKAEIADMVASGLWYLAQSHPRNMQEVAKVESVVEWLDSTNIEVLTCVDGWQRIAYGYPDPLANQFPHARMLEDKDANNRPDGFMGSCVWDTSTASPVESTFCMSVFGDTEFYCYGPEVGLNALSLWMKSAASCGGAVQVIWGTADFEWAILGEGWNRFYPDTAWARVDSSVCPNMVIDVEDEVDRIRIIIRPIDCESITVAYPELVLNAEAGVETVEREADGMHDLVVRPNPVRCGEAVKIAPARDVVLYDVLGRHVLAPKPFRSGDALAIDTSGLVPGVYFIMCRHPRHNGAHLVVIP